MKIYFNRAPIEGPWGGGTKVLRAVVDALRAAGHSVVYSLDRDIDLIVCWDPRRADGFSDYESCLKFTKQTHVPIVQRVGDIGTHGKPELTQLVIASSIHSDTCIFPSKWALENVEFMLASMDVRTTRQWHVVPNAPMRVFYLHRHIKDSIPSSNVSFVTHHWSTNEKKGFKFYRQLREWAATNDHAFTYIGRAPDGLVDKPPMTAIELAKELPRHDVYVTASVEEAGANHVLEAIATGLPVIYHRSGGSVNEYCAGYGASFDGSIESFIVAFDDLRANYHRIRKNISHYHLSVSEIAQNYVSIIEGFRHD